MKYSVFFALDMGATMMYSDDNEQALRGRFECSSQEDRERLENWMRSCLPGAHICIGDKAIIYTGNRLIRNALGRPPVAARR